MQDYFAFFFFECQFQRNVIVVNKRKNGIQEPVLVDRQNYNEAEGVGYHVVASTRTPEVGSVVSTLSIRRRRPLRDACQQREASFQRSDSGVPTVRRALAARCYGSGIGQPDGLNQPQSCDYSYTILKLSILLYTFVVEAFSWARPRGVINTKGAHNRSPLSSLCIFG